MGIDDDNGKGTTAVCGDVVPDRDTDRYIGSGFRSELSHLLNRYSMENGSNTPDYILAAYLTSCLATFDNTMRERECWYGRSVDLKTEL